MVEPIRRSLSRALAALAAVAAMAAPSGAVVRYVSPGGADTNNGLSAATAWRTIAKANGSSAAGDVILVANGTYADFPNPSSDGQASARITYVGNLADPSTVVITPRGTLTRSHVTMKGFTLNGGFTVSGTRDSLADCIGFGGRSDLAAATDCMLARLVVNSGRFWIYGQEADSVLKATRDTIQDCVFNLNTNDTGGHVVRMRSVDACVFDRNVWNITSGPSAVGASAFKLFWVRRCTFRDSRWNIVNNCTGACDEAGWFMQRDYTQMNAWSRDTIDLGGAGQVQFFGSGSGSYPGSVMNNNYDRMLVRLRGSSAYGGAMVYQDAARWDTLTNCTIVGSSSGLLMNGALEGPVLVDHCTIVGFNPSLGSFGSDVGQTTVWSGTVALHSNVFATAASAPRSKNAAAAYIPYNAANGKLVSNWNVFWTPMPRDSAIYVAGQGLSAPGTGKLFCNLMRADSSSVWGSPRFADSSSVATFDSRVLSGSTALGAGWSGGDAGAFPFSATTDAGAPEAVEDLVAAGVTASALTLEWAAPADLPNGGPVTAYDLRWSTSPINASTFASAAALPSPPTPGSPGAYQAYGVSGLTGGSTYWFAVRARDAAGNWSAVSNVVSVVASPDHTPPAGIVDLGAR